MHWADRGPRPARGPPAHPKLGRARRAFRFPRADLYGFMQPVDPRLLSLLRQTLFLFIFLFSENTPVLFLILRSPVSYCAFVLIRYAAQIVFCVMLGTCYTASGNLFGCRPKAAAADSFLRLIGRRRRRMAGWLVAF